MRRVWETAYAHVQVCGAGECGVCELFARLHADPRRPEWERAAEAEVHEATLRRQDEVTKQREWRDDG